MLSIYGEHAKTSWASLSDDTKTWWGLEAKKLNNKMKKDKKIVCDVMQSNPVGPYGGDDKYCPLPIMKIYEDLAGIQKLAAMLR